MLNVFEQHLGFFVVVLGKLDVGQLILIILEIIGHLWVLPFTLILEDLFKLQPKTHSEYIVIKVEELVNWHVAHLPTEVGDLKRFFVKLLEVVCLLSFHQLVKAH